MKMENKTAHGPDGLTHVVPHTLGAVLLGLAGLLVLGLLALSVPAYRLRHAPSVVDIGTGQTDITPLLGEMPIHGSPLMSARECCWDTGPTPQPGVWNSYLTLLQTPIWPIEDWINGYAVLDAADVTTLLASFDDWDTVELYDATPVEDSRGRQLDNEAQAENIAAQLRAASQDDGEWTWLYTVEWDGQANHLECEYYLEPNRGIVIFVMNPV